MPRPLRSDKPMTGWHMRADPAVLREFTAATGDQAAETTRRFWEWYIRRPGAKLPKRPPPGEPGLSPTP